MNFSGLAVIHRAGMHQVMPTALVMISFQGVAVFLQPYIAAIMIVRFIGEISFSFYTIS
jgi:hypothetical protein